MHFSHSCSTFLLALARWRPPGVTPRTWMVVAVSSESATSVVRTQLIKHAQPGCPPLPSEMRRIFETGSVIKPTDPIT